MSWREPNDFEWAILADVKASWPDEIIALARCLALAPRIEPLLLRNARLNFVPQAQAEAESLLWFSPLVAARSTSEIVFHLGVSKALAQECTAKERESHWQFTQKHTRHWSAEDRLERDLRYYALQDDSDRLKRGLREILRRIRDEPSENSIALSRLVKRTLPVIAQLGRGSSEAMLLAQYAALALGDAGVWVQPGPPQALPEWLKVKLPNLPASIPKAELGVEIRADGRNQVLHFVAADKSVNSIPLPSPLPAQLHVASDGPGAWHTVSLDTRIAIKPPSQHLRLTTLDGRQWMLRMDAPPVSTPNQPASVSPLWLVHTEADSAQAQAIADWLKAQGVDVQLQAESSLPTNPNIPSPTGGEGGQSQSKVVRLWTQAAHRYWAGRPAPETQAVADGLLLRIENVDLPRLGTGLGHVLDWRDWTRLDASPKAPKLLDNLRRWRDGGEIESEPLSETDSVLETESVFGDGELSPEIQSLLAEIDNPETTPPRRLEIGDRLAALGDPRPGVGVVEIQVPIPLSDAGSQAPAWERDAVPSREREPSGFPPNIQVLLDEIHNPATEPPRRLAIGDELEKLGDPRRGVGLDANGLPDIDWVEVPGGSFIYQNGETRELPPYWISRYPVTNRQFQAFIAAGGYQKPAAKRGKAKAILDKLTGQRQTDSVLKTESVLAELWKDLQQPKPKESTWPQGNRPRTDVDWYEANAFTRWLSAVSGMEIRLPTEQEWEKAARGEHGLIYPWGNEYRSGFANIDEKSSNVGPWYLQQTTAVGLYPEGRSPYQVEDMSGTVWEWCLNKYAQPDMTKADTSGDSRVVRGGSWINIQGYARADDRYWLNPDLRDSYRGFRVLSVVPIHAVR